MTQTTAALGLRPVANALGMSVVGDGHPRLGHVGQRAEPVDHAVQLGRLLGRDLLGVHGEHGDLVAEEVLAERAAPNADDQDQDEAVEQGEEDADERRA